MNRCDIAIVGGGLAGSALALALAGSGWRIALLEVRGGNRHWAQLEPGVDTFDLRVSAISPASSAWLAGIGAWQALRSRRPSPYEHMQVWDGEGTGAIGFDAAELNRPLLGHIVENRELEAALWQGVQQSRSVELLCPVRLQHWRRRADGSELVLEDGRTLHASLVVAADGARSSVRELAGFRSRSWDYGQRAIVATVRSEKPHGRTARQVFLPSGPVALLPLHHGDDEQLCSLVWSADSSRATALLELNDAAFGAELERAMESRLGQVEALSARAAFDLRQSHAIDYVQPGIALVGDAAHSIHPLAGQGINLGFADVAALAAELLRAKKRGLEPGDEAVLLRYQRRRKGENLAMMAAMEAFKRVFGSRHPALRLLRNSGLGTVDALGPLKRQLMRHAMGLESPGPGAV